MSSNWYEKFKQEFAASICGDRESAPGEIEIHSTPQEFFKVLEGLKNLWGGSFEHLADLTAYDEAPQSPRFHMVYELISMTRKERCSVVVALNDVSPTIRSVCSLWKGANWLEREVYDMYGINFEGHPDLRRILMPPSFVGYPLRKDFVVDYRQDFIVESGVEDLFDPFGNTIVKETQE